MTSADIVVPSLARETKRAIWDIGAIRVLDGGSDGDLGVRRPTRERQLSTCLRDQ